MKLAYMWVTVAVVLLIFAAGLQQPAQVALIVALLIALVCAGVIARASMPTVGVWSIVLFTFTASWDQASVGGVKPRMLFLVLGLLLLVLGYAINHRPSVPWWIHVYALAAALVTLIQAFLPVSSAYLATRYATSAAGQALLTRPGALPSLLSLLFNSYAVPLGVVLACMYKPKALRWIITAYVTGASLSNLAAYLGYQGYPVLLKLLVPAIAAHTRALGFTSHPLHLATSGVLAVALACWLAVQPAPLSKWIGRASLIALFLGLYASGSRGGNGAGLFALASSAFLLPTVRRRIHAVAAATAAVLAGILIFAPSLGASILRTTRLYGGLTNDVSNTGRTQVLDQGLIDFLHSPLYGIGPRYIAEAHILYVGVLASGGVLFFAAYLAFNAGSLRAARRSISVDRALGGALLATLLSTLVYWAVADDFQVASVQVLYGFVLALLLREGPDAVTTRPRDTEAAGEADGGTGVDALAENAPRPAGRSVPRKGQRVRFQV